MRFATSLHLLILTAAALVLCGSAVSAQIPPPLIRPKVGVPKTVAGARQPRVVSFRVTDGPYLGFDVHQAKPTKVEAELADFDPTAERVFRPSLWAIGCENTGVLPSSEPGGNPYKVRWEFTFVGIENSGKQCTWQIQPYRPGTPTISVGQVQLPRVQTYTITNTWDLLSLRTPSGKRLTASARKGVLPCELASVGTAGTFSTGVVNDGGDLSFQLRNGLLREDCEFDTSPALEVKPDFYVSKVDWQFTSDSLCNAGGNEFATQASSGQTVTFFFDPTAIFAVRFGATCRPDSHDPTRNSHLYKARLASVRIFGPAGRRWQDAFK